MITKESKLPFVVGGLFLCLLMVAMDNTIVATALPTIISKIGGVE